MDPLSGPLPYGKLLGVGVIRWVGYGLAGVSFWFVAGGIIAAIHEIRRGNGSPLFSEALERSRAHLPAIAASALLQFSGLLLSMLGCFWLAANFVQKTGLPTKSVLGLGYLTTALVVSVFSRWMLSVPIIIEEGCAVFTSFRRSQELTANHTPAMWFFAAHGVVAGYIAGMFPYYVFGLVARRMLLPMWSGWVPFILSLALVAWTEPLFAIGCAVTYFSASETEAQQQE